MTAPFVRDKLTWLVSEMTPLRERRLLMMAKTRGHNHKAFYSEYCYLIDQGLIGWRIGSAFLMPAGEERLSELLAADTPMIDL